MISEPLWKAEDVIRITRGSCLHEQAWQARGVAIDSRMVVPGDLFIALKGPIHDGHDYVAEAFAAGAVAAIVSHQPLRTTPDCTMIFVEDTFMALQDLGSAGRKRTKAKIVAVTGSVGKTSTKEMLRLSLKAVGKTYANPGSYNNHWGVPLSLANLPADAEYGVFELGMNHAGEMEDLSRQVRPDIAVITTIEAVHLEFFTSVEAIADAKAEIFKGMTKQGIAILNKDNPYYARLADAAKKQGIKKILSFAQGDKADATLLDCALTREGSAVNAMLMGYNIHYAIGAPGMHLVQNSLAAILTAAIASNQKDACASALARYTPPQGRGIQLTLSLPTGGTFTLIDDSYNASPVSVEAAINVLGSRIPSRGGRRFLILGDMLELGTSSAQLHSELAHKIEAVKIDGVFCCGPMMHHLYDALPYDLRYGYAPDSAQLIPYIVTKIYEDDIITIKGSKSMNMGIIIEALKNMHQTSAEQMVG
jgi:UDP-N-acetylmuramoyl-tripeptide--D-alanyl-D-alanine ligase